MGFTDKELGMDRKITRRDFMNGAAMAIGAAATPPDRVSSATTADTRSRRTRPATIRPRSMACAAATRVRSRWRISLRDGTFWRNAGQPIDTGEPTIWSWWVAASADSRPRASFTKPPAKQARVLILENHDDFGGHAKRNEFRSQTGPPCSATAAPTRSRARLLTALSRKA